MIGGAHFVHKNEETSQNHAKLFSHSLPLKSETQRRKKKWRKKELGGDRILVKYQASVAENFGTQLSQGELVFGRRQREKKKVWIQSSPNLWVD